MSMSSFFAMQKQLDQMSRAMRPSYVDAFMQMEKALEPFRRSHLALAEHVKASGVLARFQEIAQANQWFISAFDRIKLDTRWVDDFSTVHASWTRSIHPIQDQLAHLQASAKLTLSASSQIATIAERLHAGIDFDKIGRAFKIQDDLAAQVQKRFGELTRGFDSLARSIEPLQRLTVLPSFLVPSASREIFVTGYATLELSPEDVETVDDHDAEVLSGIREEVSGVIGLLNRVNPALAVAYQGAREALASTTADRKRHVLVSLREMWGHLLRHIAPDEKVLPWASGKGGDLLHEGKPTRRARVLYVCREINHEPLSEFVNADTAALVKLVEMFNRVHELEPGLSDTQLNALLLRTDSWLTFIIQISEEGREC